MIDNRTKILQCAEDLFWARGYDAVGIQEIVDKAGVTKPTLYYYFGSKGGLLEALMGARLEKLLESMREVLAEPGDIRELLERMAGIHIDSYQKEPKFYLMTMASLYSARESEAYRVVRPYIIQLYEITVQAFEREAKQLGNMNGRQRQFAIGFLGTVHHYLLMCEWEGNDDFADRRQEIIHSLVHQFMHGIFS